MIEKLIQPVTKILDKFIPDADTKQQIAYELATMSQKHIHEIAKAQIEVNKEEAKGNWFQSGWRPATARVCVFGFAINFLISPLASAFGIAIPQADTSTMLPVLMGMLGLGGLRTYERVQGVGK